MRVALALVVVGMVAGTAHAERRKNSVPLCFTAAHHLTTTIGASATSEKLIAKRCEADRWSAQMQGCLSLAKGDVETRACLDKLTKDQRTALDGDADRLGESRLRRWLSPMLFQNKRAVLPPSVNPNIVLAVYNDVPDVRSARLLQKQGVSAYQAGRYELSVRKLSAAIDVDPTPELVYHLAQAYRLKGDRANALEQYEHYLEIAPDGAAASACRAQIEKLRDDVP